ncbi:MAG: DUF2306 domain-containing protein [Roseibium sp.]
MSAIMKVVGQTMFWVSTVLAVVVALVSYRFIPLGVELAMEFLAHNLKDNSFALYAHIAVAPIALALMPFQFMKRLRARKPSLHRWTGRIYVAAVFISGAAGLQLAFHSMAGGLAVSGFALLAVAWLGTTMAALWFALRRDILRHQAWMVRSAALTFAAVTLRIYLPLSMVSGFEFEIAYPIISWACWLPNLIAAELFLLFKRQPRTAVFQTNG